MDMPALLATAGLALLGLIGYVVLLVIGEVALDQAKEAMFGRRSFALRRHRYRGLMVTGYACGVLALLAGFLWLVIATNGHPEDADDARLFGAAAVVFAVGAIVLFGEWWRRAGR